jgi:hypothetical protein
MSAPLRTAATPQMAATKVVQKTSADEVRRLRADVCVVGAGIAGISAAVESARLGRSVVLVDALPRLGGQAVNGVISSIAGLLSNGPAPFQLTYGIASDILRELGASGDLHLRRKNNTVMYDDGALGRWVEDTVYALGITVVLGGVLRDVRVHDGRVTDVAVATRYGDVGVTATGYVDASGDAALVWNAGLPCHEPAEGVVYGSQKVVLEGVVEDGYPTADQMRAALDRSGERYGVVRRDGLANLFAGKGRAILNMAHTETPLDPVLAAQRGYEGRIEADKTILLLKAEFPRTFGDAHVKSYGLPGVRQTRWIKGSSQLTVDALLAGTRPRDAVARTGWGIELHNELATSIWEPLPEGHLHYVSFGNLTPPDLGNVVAAGRCIDGDVAALSSVRVMGPCIATGAAAAHGLDLAGAESVHEIDLAELQQRLHDNLERTDAYAEPLPAHV